MTAATVLVIKRDGRFSSLLRENGCHASNLELIGTVPNEDLGELNATLERMDEYDGLFITSPAAAEVFVRQLKSIRRNFAGPVYALGDRAGAMLSEAGLNVVVPESANTAAELIRSFEDAEFAGKHFLFIRGDQSMRTIPARLASTARIDEVEVYRTVEIPPTDDVLESIRSDLRNKRIDWICFFSPSGVRSFVKLFGTDVTKETAVAVIGETTESSAREAGLMVNYVSPEASAEAFANGLIEHLQTID